MLASEIIRRVREIQVRTGRHVADVLAGEYISVFRGGGIEFEEVRPYVPGDDVRSIDWNVTARTGEPYIKRYVEERQLTLMLVADVSGSQNFGSVSRSKRDTTAELCALLAFSAIRNDDKVGLVLFHEGIEQYIPPRKGQKHALRVIREVLAHGTIEATAKPKRAPKLVGNASATPPEAKAATSSIVEQAQARAALKRDRRSATGLRGWLRTFFGLSNDSTAPGRGTDINQAVEFVLSVSKRKAVCFVVSDFLDEGFERTLRIANQRHDVIAVLVSDPAELELPDVGLVTLRDAESGRTQLYDTGSKAFAEAVKSTAAERVASLERRLRASGIDFIHIDAAGSVVDPLVRFFRMRERRMNR